MYKKKLERAVERAVKINTWKENGLIQNTWKENGLIQNTWKENGLIQKYLKQERVNTKSYGENGLKQVPEKRTG